MRQLSLTSGGDREKVRLGQSLPRPYGGRQIVLLGMWSEPLDKWQDLNGF